MLELLPVQFGVDPLQIGEAGAAEAAWDGGAAWQVKCSVPIPAFLARHTQLVILQLWSVEVTRL